MKIAIVGANSQIARDLAENLSEHDLVLYTRNPQSSFVKSYDAFGEERYDAIINSVGPSDPHILSEMKDDIRRVAVRFDSMCRTWIKNKNPECRYIYLSSGIVNFWSAIPSFYESTKAMIEDKHRYAEKSHNVDLRIFSYFSRRQYSDSGFLMSQVLGAIQRNETLYVDPFNATRDYISPRDFANLVRCVLAAEPINCAFDCYSTRPVTKTEILETMNKRFGLRYEIDENRNAFPPTGLKPIYIPESRAAEKIGYRPQLSSLETLVEEMDAIFAHA